VKCLSSNLPQYDHIIRWCLEDVLKLEGYDLKVTFCVLLIENGNFQYPNTIKIDQHLDESETIRVLFHEIRHYYQYITDMFNFDFEKYYGKLEDEEVDEHFMDWNHIGNLFMKRYETYLTLPWELDANEFMIETMKQWHKVGKVNSQKYIWHGNYENYDNR